MFVEPESGKKVKLEEVIERARYYDIIIFGEKHDSEDCHHAELKLLKALSKAYPIIFSLEMFERDVQKYLDDYLNGKITEEDFLRKSRPWGNYSTDYRPLIEYCKSQGIYVVAANVPRYIASKVAKEGIDILESLSDEEKNFVANRIFYDNEEYRKRFYETMEKIHMPGFSEEMKENYYKAQCLKDATMAESILEAFQTHQGYKVFHINGSFHSDYKLGVVFQLKRLNPSLRILVIAPLERGEEGKVKRGIGDLIFRYEK